MPINLEWAKLKAVAKHLNCSEYQAKEQLDSGTMFIYSKEEARRIKEFLRKFPVRQTTEVQLEYDGNVFVLVKDRP